MQGNTSFYSGWRKTMEDADICNLDLGDGNSLFAVFDGHGGINQLIQDIKLANT
jgi:serine/threonine protein phosphatase PrpC